MLNIAIAGGGIGGLSAALSLAQHGHQITVFEQTSTVSGIGAGIQLSPNCTRVLYALGLADALKQYGFLPLRTEARHWRTGKLIMQSPLGETVANKYGAPYYHIHRGDLAQLLSRAVAATSNIELITNTRVSTLLEENNGTGLVIHNGNTELIHHADVVIGADGIHSVVRKELWGAEVPRFTGNIAWRALVPVQNLPKDLIPPVSGVWWGPGKHFVHYYVSGGKFVNCVCVVEKEGWEIEGWQEPGEYAELKADFAGWHTNIQQLIDQADHQALYKWALFDRAPMPQWGKGQTTLLGDACHPTLPFMAQGAAMAIEDGAVLASCLPSTHKQMPKEDIRTALQRYEDLRKKRTAGVQMGSRRNARVFHLAGFKAWARDRAAAKAGGRVLDNLFKYDALNAAKSAAKD